MIIHQELSRETAINYQEIKLLIMQAFENHGVVKEYKKNTFLFKEGDQPEGIYLIMKGLIKLSQSTEEGENITFFLRQKEAIIGLSEVLLQQKRERYAQCLLDSKVCMIGAAEFQHMVKTDLNITLGFLIRYTATFLETMNNIKTLLTRPVPWRIAWLFKHLELNRNVNAYCIDLPLNHEEISNIIGCNRQTVTKVLNRWRADKLISYSRKQIIIHDPEQFFAEIHE